MDVTGAEALRQRLAQQEHWREARLVRLGRQPAFDPDGYALESFHDDVRVYRVELRLERNDGRSATVTRRIRKHLVDGAWEPAVVAAGLHDLN
jgi:hypothetical protein